mgnify:CR=1 FL=1
MSQSLVQFPRHNLLDVPQSLRRLADQIENGDVPNSIHSIVVCESDDGEICVYGYGEIGNVASEVGLLTMAATKLQIR